MNGTTKRRDHNDGAEMNTLRKWGGEKKKQCFTKDYFKMHGAVWIISQTQDSDVF